MKKVCLLFVLFSSYTYGQTELEKQAETELTELSKQYEEAEIKYKEELEKFVKVKEKINPNTKDFKELEEQGKVTSDAKEVWDDAYTSALNFMGYFEKKGVAKDLLVAYFPYTHSLNTVTAASVVGTVDATEEIDTITNEPPKVFYYYGDNNVIDEKDLLKHEVAKKIFTDLLLKESKSYLGDFVIPIKNQTLLLYKENKNKKKGDTLDALIPSPETVRFKEVKVHILEGSVYDIQVFVLDLESNELMFENRYPISLLRYTTFAPFNFLFFKGAMSNNKKVALQMKEYEKLSLKLTDVLSYYPNPGNNYLPENLVLRFPAMLDSIETNLTSSAKYKVNQDTALENIVELRTYTDFLGLFADSDNGLVQLEGKADFYVAPFNLGNSPVYIFKKISPFVNFSRLDEDTKYVEVENKENDTYTMKNSLELLEKSYLEMGAKLNLFSIRFTKEYPFDLNLYVPARYQIADVKIGGGTTYNYKILGLGGGILFEFRRFNNFGFNIGLEVVKYQGDGLNDIDDIEDPNSFLTTRYDAEIYYFPGDTKKQSIFLRLKTFNNSTLDNGEAFYQLQFGYRFSIGVGKIKR